MASCNIKLYEKYENLKKRKFYEEEEWNQNRDADLIKYESAAVDLIEELKNTHEWLQAELYSFQEQFAECEKLLLEEGKKCNSVYLMQDDPIIVELLNQYVPGILPAKELSEEVGRLQKLLSQKNDITDSLVMASPITTPRARSMDISKSSERRTLQFCKEKVTQNEAVIITSDSLKVGTKVPDCCKGMVASSGNASENCRNCVFQTLMMFLVGMDFSVDNQTENLRLLVVHKMSGFSFSLTWIQHEGGEGEWMYQVSSLGTLEKVALAWMKEDVIFSAGMCRAFFERVSRVIGRC